MVLASAADEARRRGERRIGTDHLLLALLRDKDSPAARALGVSLADARATSDELDKGALAAVGVEVDTLGEPVLVAFSHRFPPLTSSARAVLKRTADATRRRKHPPVNTTDFLLAVLSLQRPDPAAELLETLGVDSRAVRDRIEGNAKGDVA